MAIGDEGGQSDSSAGSDSTTTTLESDEDTPLGAGGWGALLALALFAFTGPVAAYLCHTRPCYIYTQSYGSRHFGGLERWSWVWRIYVVDAPVSLAFAGWCVFVSRRAQSDVLLHTWTLRFGALSFTSATAIFALPLWDQGCHGRTGEVWRAVAALVQKVSWTGCMAIPFYLLTLRLRGLGRLQAARAVLASVLVAVFFFAVVGYKSALLGLGTTVVVIGFGAGGLLASARQAARSRRKVSVKAARLMVRAAWLVSASTLLLIADLVTTYWTVRRPESWLAYLTWISSRCASTVARCLEVAILSGLSGSESQRRMAVKAFEMINTYRDYELQAYYEEFLDYLDEAKVRWIRVRYLFQLAASGKAMVRCQDVPPSEFIVGSEGFPRSREERKHRFVLSHPWLRPEHPDSEDGLKLGRLVEQLSLLHAEVDDAVFIDFMSLPQHDKCHPDFTGLLRQREQNPDFQHPALRTREEDRSFKTALHHMELLYSMSSTPVIVLPMDDATTKGAGYLSRGWCFFEFALAFNFDNIINAEIYLEVEKMRDHLILQKCDSLEGFTEEFGKTHFTDKGDSEIVRDLFQHILNRPLPDSVVERHPSDSSDCL